MTAFNPELIHYASTDLQRERLQKWLELGSQKKAAEEMGCDDRRFRDALQAAQKNAARQGYAPGHWESGVAPGYNMGKVTVQRGAGGVVERVWERQHPEQEAFSDFIKTVRSELLADITPIKIPELEYSILDDDVIPWFQFGDAHFGMVSYMRETGHNFDLEIAEAEFLAAFRHLLSKAPPAKRCVLNDLGDFTHYENFKAETERGGFRLDADTRFPKMIQIYVRIKRALILEALKKYEVVDVLENQGNHSRTNDIWAREYTKLFGELIEVTMGGSGRVNAINNESVFTGYLMDNTFVMVHHGDKCSGEKLVDVMFSDFRDEVRQAEYLYIDTGHVHHKYAKKERGIVLVESWNNLAPNDKHHHDAGYRSKQSMSVALRSRKYGQIGTFTIPVEMIWAGLSKAAGVKTSEPIRKRAFNAT